MTKPDEYMEALESGQHSPDELRANDRHALMLRGAKLVCESGEYLCIIRDVSETGVRLRLFHALPRDPQLALELANGDVYFIERIWERGDEAGFRFAAPIDVHAFISEPSPYPRRPLRLRISLDALVFTDEIAREAEVLDLSQYGACIETRRPLPIGRKIRLEAEGLPPLAANICWRSRQRHGLVFRQSFAFNELARLAGKLQDCGKKPGMPTRTITTGQTRYA